MSNANCCALRHMKRAVSTGTSIDIPLIAIVYPDLVHTVCTNGIYLRTLTKSITNTVLTNITTGAELCIGVVRDEIVINIARWLIACPWHGGWYDTLDIRKGRNGSWT